MRKRKQWTENSIWWSFLEQTLFDNLCEQEPALRLSNIVDKKLYNKLQEIQNVVRVFEQTGR